MSKSKKLDFRSKLENRKWSIKFTDPRLMEELLSQRAIRNPTTPMNAVCPAQPVRPVLKMPSDLAGSQLSSCSHALYKVRLRERLDDTSVTLHQNQMAAATGLRKTGKKGPGLGQLKKQCCFYSYSCPVGGLSLCP